MIIIEPLLEPTIDDLARILEMFKKIPGRTCSAAAFLKYLQYNWHEIRVFVGSNSDGIAGFTIAEKPRLLEPKIGWLPFSYADKSISREFTKEGFAMAEAWLKEQGAEIMRFTSVRKPKALKRVYGLTPSKEVIYEKPI